MTTHRYSQQPFVRRRRSCALVVVGLVGALLAPLAGIRPAVAGPGDISTIVGGGKGGLGDGGLATEAKLAFPWGLARSGGDLYVSDNGAGRFGQSPFGDRLRRVDASGAITTVAGGVDPPPGDGLPGPEATLDQPSDLAFDAAGNLYIADSGHRVVRRVDVATGIITTVAGNGGAGATGDGNVATKAQIGSPSGLALDTDGNLYIADAASGVVRRVDAVTHRISTVAGGGDPPDGLGDGGPATSAALNPRGLAVDHHGNLLVADIGNMRIRRVDRTTGIITTVAGNGGTDPAREGAKAARTSAPFPEGVAVDAAGSIYFTSVVVANVVYRVDHATKRISVVAGGGAPADGLGDGLPGPQAALDFPLDVAVDGEGDVLIADLQHFRVRRLDHATGIISTYAGTGGQGFNGDGLPARDTLFDRPAWLALGPDGDLFVSDDTNDRVRRVDAATTIVSTVAGGGVGGPLPGAQASLFQPRGLAVDNDGNVLIADCGNHRVRRYHVTSGMVTTVAGGGQPPGGVGDGLAATDAGLLCPSGIHVVPPGTSLPAGTLFIADAGQHRVRRVGTDGVITTVAGTGVAGFNGDGRPATQSRLTGPSDVVVDGAGDMFVSDTGNHRVRRIDAATGRTSTVAGNGGVGIGGDGVPATSTEVSAPIGLLLQGPSGPLGGVPNAGQLLIANSAFPRVLRLDLSSGILSTVAGTGVPGFSGDGGPAVEAALDLPTEMVVDPAGDLLFTDRDNHRVRKVEAGSPPPPPVGCGAVITADTTLTADVGPCPGDGIVIGADDVTLDLAGHRLTGGGPGDGARAGVLVRNRTGVTVTGNADPTGPRGVVSDFNGGVVIVGGSGNVVTNVALRHNVSSYRNGLYGDGLAIFFSAHNRIVDNTIVNNGPYDGIAVLGFGSNGNLIQGNDIRDNSALGVGAAGTGIGIILTPFFSFNLPREVSIFDNRVIANNVSGNDNGGISHISNINGVIRDNTVVDNGLGGDFPFPANGIGVSNLALANPVTRVVIAYNRVHGNGNAGIQVTSQGNRITNNDAAHNHGVLGDADLSDFHEDCDANVWARNTYATAFPDCTAVDGHQVPGGPPSGAEAAPTAPPPPPNRPVPPR